MSHITLDDPSWMKLTTLRSKPGDKKEGCKMNFAKLMLAAAVAAGTMIATVGCGDSQIKLVKNGILELDKSRSIQTALDARCSSVKWEKYKNNNGQTLVHAEGVWKDTQFKTILEKNPNLRQARSMLINAYASQGGKYQDPYLFPGDKVNIYFIINVDNKTFEVGRIEILDEKGQPKWAPQNMKDVSDMLQIIYTGTM